MSPKHDFLDEMIAERTARNADFPKLLEQAQRRRELLHKLGELRECQRLSQTMVAAGMGTSQSAVARIESIASDAKISTVERFAGAVGMVLQYHLVPATQAADLPAVIVHEESGRVLGADAEAQHP